MSDKIIKAPNNKPLKITNAHEIDDEFNHSRELEDKEYPRLNEHGQKLFDANGNTPLTDEEREEMISRTEEKFEEVLDILRISRNDPNSQKTPHRIAKMLVNELFVGRYTEPPKLTVFPNRNQVNNLVISKGIKVMSVCSHHWQPISGFCTIGYIPDKHVIGLSKLTRITDWFSRRGQIQEELGEQIADYLEDLLEPKALGVVINAKHYCMIARGVNASEDKSTMITSVVRGYLMDDLNLRNEFMTLIENSH
jgi:GTP cyclohydrolase I